MRVITETSCQRCLASARRRDLRTAHGNGTRAREVERRVRVVEEGLESEQGLLVFAFTVRCVVQGASGKEMSKNLPVDGGEDFVA